MPILEFVVQVVRTTEVRVRIDSETYNEEKMAEFRKSMYRFTTLREHAEHLAQFCVRFDKGESTYRGTFIEGYGQVRVNDDAGKTYDETGNNPVPIEPWEDINVLVGEEDVEIDLQSTKEVASLVRMGGEK